MQLHRLEVEGFGPFRDRQVVDFDAFAADGIFLIGGRTGAGKSSILDAVCFALYGGVPRYDGGEKRLRSDHCRPEDPTTVVVEFSTVAGRFRVTRSPAYERPARRGGGMTTQTASALLEQHTDAGWVGRAARAVDVADELAGILQLSQEQFLQVILLAQNRFADFLLADSRERQALLRRLFGTARFADHQTRIEERRRAAEQALAGRRATVDARLDEAERIATEAQLWGDDVDAPPQTTDARIARLQRAVARAEYGVERGSAQRLTAETALTEADAALSGLKEQRRSQSERDRTRIALAALEAQGAEIADAAARRDRARAAESLRSVIAAARRAASALSAAVGAEALAVDAARGAGVPVDAAGADPAEDSADRAAHLRAFASELTRAGGAWEQAAQFEQDAPRREAERAAADAAMAAASDKLAVIEAERAALPERIAALTAEHEDARRAGDRADAAAQDVTAAERRRSGARDVRRLSAALAEAARAEAEATEAHTRAQSALSLLRQRRLDGYAGELATALTDGEACIVCGSVEHPAPALHADPVSADDIDAAAAVRDAAATAERTASDLRAARAVELAAAQERSGGVGVEEAEEAFVQATAAASAAEAAAARAAEIAASLDGLRQDETQIEQRRATAVEAVNAARTALSLIQQRVADADAVIARARGDHDTVADRLAEAQRRISAAVRAADAVDERIDRMQAAEAARAELAAAVDASDFADVDDVEDAMLERSEIDALDARVTAHAVDVKKERARLLDLEMQVLPEETIDLAPAEESARGARSSWEQAVDALSHARGVQQGLTATLSAAAGEHTASAAETADFEVLRGLADALAGRAGNTRRMNLETFVLAAELEEIVQAANLRLHDMSDGRYQLRHSDALAARGAASGLGIVVFDAFTGQTRPAASLSGGETFLSSLALALGLAEVVTARAGGIRLDTLFIDEGFGSLDADTLETAMRTLDELRQGGRTVGVISHVEAMQEQIPAQLTVRALPDGPSVIDAPRPVGPSRPLG